MEDCFILKSGFTTLQAYQEQENTMEDMALLIIDVQNDYFSGGNMALPGAEDAAARITSILDEFRARNLPIIHVQHESISEGSTFFLPGTKGQLIHPSVEPGPGEKVIVKNFPNGFLKTDLQQYLQSRGVNHLVITGMMTFMCVDATTRAAKDLGFECTLVHDCTASPPVEFGAEQCTAPQVVAAFTCALSYICDCVVSADEMIEQLRSS